MKTKFRKHIWSEDSHEQTMFFIWAEWNALGFLLAFGLVYLAAHAISIFGAILWALLLLAIGNLAIFAFFGVFRKGVNALFGIGRPVDQEELNFDALGDLAEGKYRRAEYTNAAELYRRLVDDPLNKNAEYSAFRLAEIYAHQLARPDDALYWYRKAMAIIRNKDQDHFTENALWPDLLRGLSLFDAAKATDDADFQVLLVDLQTAIQDKRIEDAAAISADLLRRYPANADSWFWAALVEVRRGLPARAIDHYYQAVARDPNHRRAQYNLAMLLCQQERFVEAREMLQTYLAAARDDPREAEYVAEAERKLAEMVVELTPNLTERGPDE